VFGNDANELTAGDSQFGRKRFRQQATSRQ